MANITDPQETVLATASGASSSDGAASADNASSTDLTTSTTMGGPEDASDESRDERTMPSPTMSAGGGGEKAPKTAVTSPATTSSASRSSSASASASTSTSSHAPSTASPRKGTASSAAGVPPPVSIAAAKPTSMTRMRSKEMLLAASPVSSISAKQAATHSRSSGEFAEQFAHPQQEQMVRLNVGGKKFITTRSTIFSHGENLLTHLVTRASAASSALTSSPSASSSSSASTNRAATSVGVTQDDDGFIFIDRDGKAFGVILNFLRTGKILPTAGITHELLLSELDYYQLLTDDTVNILYASSAASTPQTRSRSNTNDLKSPSASLVGLPRSTEFLGFTEKLRRTAADWLLHNAETMTHLLMEKAHDDTGQGLMNHPLVIQFSSKSGSPLSVTCTCDKKLTVIMPDLNGLFLRQLEQVLRHFVSPYYMCFVEGRRASGNSHVQCRFVAQPYSALPVSSSSSKGLSSSNAINNEESSIGSSMLRTEALLMALYSRIEGWNRHDVKYGGSSLSTVAGGPT